MLSRDIVRTFRHGHVCCGLGAGAKGFNRANPRVGHLIGRFDCAGGIDNDPGALANFERQTGTKGTLLDLFSEQQYAAFHDRAPAGDWREALPDDFRLAFGPTPDVVFASMPCKGFSGLLSATKSETAKYQALNGLTLRGMWLLLEAYKDDPIPIILFENVPRIGTRGRWLLDQIIGMFRSFGYLSNEGVHDCGKIGNLAQSRDRRLVIFRHAEKVPPFVYEPPQRRLRGVGEVIGKLPLPGDPVAGSMHRIPALQWQTWVRLAFVEAGKDWRSLNRLEVEDGVLRDFGIVPEIVLRDGALGVHRWEDTAGVVIGNQRSPLHGRHSVADPRCGDWQSDVLGVRSWGESTGVVAARSSPTNGAYSVADPRPEYGPATHSNVLGVRDWQDPAHVVSGSPKPTSGAHAVADPRPGYSDKTQTGILHVADYHQPARTVTSAKHPAGAAMSVADPRPTQANQTFQQYGVRDWDETSVAVSGQSGPGGGPYSVADPRLHGRPRFNNVYRIVRYEDAAPAVAGPGGPAGGLAVADPRPAPSDYSSRKYKVTQMGEASRAVIGASTTGDGAFAVADPRTGFGPNSHRNKLKVAIYEAPSPTVTGSDRVGSGALSVADPRPFQGKERSGWKGHEHYGVLPWTGTAKTISGSPHGYDNGFNSVSDPREVDLDLAPLELPKARQPIVCRIIALDGTWHRPFTTLDLASLQSIVEPEEVFAFDPETGWSVRAEFEIASKSDAQKREWIGNAVPTAAAQAMAETIGEALLLAGAGETFQLSTRQIWVKPLALAFAVDPRQAAIDLDTRL